ncbi:homoserine kinase [Corynebacterium incognita]|uniref:homoserine kinase n=1 Tax=Corynebacterium incognita TaxID=2754725 RepID=UPI001FE40AB5|nr:homoserine kinase [Corynebacterium incognita]
MSKISFVRVSVPATSANLGPGYDTLGMALSLYDEVTVEVVDSGIAVVINGEGAETLPRDERHLVVRAITAALRAAGMEVPGLKVSCTNNIPQSRGLGSSAAAAVAGVMAGNALAGFSLSDADVVQLASEFEGHPDNAAAAVLGGAVVSWTGSDTATSGVQYQAQCFAVHEDIRATAFVPQFHASTNEVRGVLPDTVSHADAAFNVARGALQVLALQHNPELLFEATRDVLHQPYRAGVLGVSFEWVRRLREAGVAAFLSGAGPTVLALHTEPLAPELLTRAEEEGLVVYSLRPDRGATASV